MAEREKRRATTFVTSRGAIINVAAPSVYIAPGVTPVDVTNPTELREALKEELGYGIKRFLPANQWIGDYGNVIPTDKEDEVIIFGHIPGADHSKIMRAKISDTNIISAVWTWDTPGGILAGMIDYIISLDRVLVPSYGDGRIWELDAKTGALLNTVNLGANNNMWSITSVQESPRLALATHYFRHYLGRVNLDTGVETVLFGVDGAVGDDLTHLRYPMDVEYFLGGDDVIDYYLVADSWNNRILRINAVTLTVESIYLIAGIGNITARRDLVAETFNSRRGNFYNFDCAYCRTAATRYGNLKPQGWVSALNGTRIQAFLPFDAGDKAMWSSPNSLWIAYGEKAYELDLRYFKEPQSVGAATQLVDNVAVLAGATYPPVGDQYATVLNGLHAGEVEVEIYSSQTATGYIDVPERRSGYTQVNTAFAWKQYDTFPLTADQVTGYILTNPPNIFRVRVIMGVVNGVISIYYNKKVN